MSIFDKLLAIQTELHAPKNQRNTFGGYNYRSCEDILEAVKPLCQKHGCVLILTDEVINVGARIYVRATAKLFDANGDTPNGSDVYITNTAYAREADTKKGMDDAQITGTASSYARKYALNGLFCIDDTKDADTDEYRKASTRAAEKPAEPPKVVTCRMCGEEVKGAKKGAQTLSGAQVAAQTGGLCMKCYKEAQKSGA